MTLLGENKIVDLAEIAQHQALGIIDTHGQYLTFVLDNEEYGVEILSVDEIRCWEKPTLIPNAPNFVKGVINLRGKIAPIIDLRIKFAIGKEEYNPTTVVIILKSYFADKNRITGVVVDAVSEVVNIPDEEISGSPEMGDSEVVNYVTGIANVNERVISLLDVHSLLDVT